MKKPHRLYRVLSLALTATSLVASPAAAAPSAIAGTLAIAGFGRPHLGDQARPGDQPRPRDQDRALRATREGRSMPLPMIERRVRPQMGGADYLGPELKGETYRLKYIQDGHVIWVDVDAATGRILRRSSGN